MSEEKTTLTSVLDQDDAASRRRAAESIARGGVIAFRTDTFYGLGANPLDAAAVDRINELKGREGKPILVVVSDAGEAARLVASRPPLFDALARQFWPGPLTLVAPAAPLLPAPLTAGTGTVGLRLPADEAVRDFVRACGGALTATSANRAGEPPARAAREVAAAFPAGLDLIMDGGETTSEQPSTVVDVCGDGARLIREGALPWRELLDALAES